ncbi:MAG TPA: ATP-binding protein [Bryobacteraceae bacterium]|nr:ATP-binding protein [Bryobacteraceae bacterium]
MNPFRILVVDPDPAAQQLLESALPPPKWNLESVQDDAAALARLRTAPYDVVVARIHPHGNNGLDLLHRVREMRPGARVLVMTDGAAPDAVIGAIREKAFACVSKPFSVCAVADLIERAVSAPAWSDDIQVISARPHWITLRVRCQAETADRLVQFLREMEMDLAPKQREDIAAAFRELLMNAIEHGGRYDPHKWVRVSAIRTARAIIYHIQDPGHGFSLENLPHAAISNPPDAPVQHLEVRAEQGVRPGGFGILLTRNLVDELIYNEKGNEVLFIKYL